VARRRVVVFGGAGFLGSRIVAAFVERGDEVVVVDGLMAEAGGDEAHLTAVRASIEFIPAAVEHIADLDRLVNGAALIVDCMAWTRHVAAFDNPLYDLRLNLESHLRLIQAARTAAGARILYLGSRGEYGRSSEPRITEQTPLDPRDVQSVHKAAADQHFRLFAELSGMGVISLRLPNCFGPGQPLAGKDIGLVGDWIRSALAGTPIVLYGTGRRRSLLYSDDAATVVSRLSDRPFTGYEAYNLAGRDVDLVDLAERIVRIAGSGVVTRAPMPHDVAVMDIGGAVFDDSALRRLIGSSPDVDLDRALGATITYFKERLA
jgi:UDP-glucose 4-epimerase